MPEKVQDFCQLQPSLINIVITKRTLKYYCKPNAQRQSLIDFFNTFDASNVIAFNFQNLVQDTSLFYS